MKRLRKAYPHWINNKLGNETTTNEDELIGSQFPQLKRKYSCARGNKHVKTNAISGKNFLYKLNA